MQYLIRSFRKFIVPSLACTLLITTVLTVICFITVNNTAIATGLKFGLKLVITWIFSYRSLSA